jgi:hypothetical protein
MPAQKKPERYRAKHAFGVRYDGEQITIPEGEIVRAGHPLLKGRAEHFEPVETFGRFDVDVEDASADPPAAEKPEPKRAEKRKAK